jgi:hypothetical protein
VRDAANTNLTELAPYGVKSADVKALPTGITTFAGMKTAPRSAKAARSGATGSVASLIGATRSLFRNQLDKMMTPFRKSNPDFYAGYFAARVIVNRAATQAPAPAGPSPAPKS